MRAACHAAACLAACAALGVPSTARGIAGWRGETASLNAVGALRLTGAFLYFRSLPDEVPLTDEGLQFGVLRLLLDGDLAESVSYEVNLFVDATRSIGGDSTGTFSTAGASESAYRYPGATWKYWDGTFVAGRLGVDHLHVSLDLEPWTISLGRFPVSTSVTNVFTPNDFFAPFSATAINTVYKPGIDGARVTVGIGAMSMIELVGALGTTPDDGEPTWRKSAVLLRLSTVQWGAEWAALGGKVAGREIAGGSVQADLVSFSLRGEGHVGFPDRSARRHPEDTTHVRLAVGVDKMFAWHNSTIGAEYAYYSDGAGRPEDYLERAEHLYPDDLSYLGRHYVGLIAGGEIIPILRAGAVVLVNAGDLSGIASLSLVYNIADEADFVGGLLAGWGKGPEAAATLPLTLALHSEFGATPVAVFLETRFYF